MREPVSWLQFLHNLVRPHEVLNGETPADGAGIKVEGQNKRLALIQNAFHKGEQSDFKP